MEALTWLDNQRACGSLHIRKNRGNDERAILCLLGMRLPLFQADEPTLPGDVLIGPIQRFSVEIKPSDAVPFTVQRMAPAGMRSGSTTATRWHGMASPTAHSGRPRTASGSAADVVRAAADAQCATDLLTRGEGDTSSLLRCAAGRDSLLPEVAAEHRPGSTRGFVPRASSLVWLYLPAARIAGWRHPLKCDNAVEDLRQISPIYRVCDASCRRNSAISSISTQ